MKSLENIMKAQKRNKSMPVNFSLGQMNEASKEEGIYRKHLQERVSMVC